MRKFIIKVLAAGMVLSMSGCGSRENVSGTGESSVAVQEDKTGENDTEVQEDNTGENSEDMWTFQAVVKKIEDTAVLIEPVEGAWALNSSDSIRIGKEDFPEGEDIKTGDTIEISCDGMVLETYPAMLAKIYDVRLVKSTEKIYAEGNEGNFGLLIPEGWSYEIFGEDNSEEIFGKYGIHFYPEGSEKGYIEVSLQENFGVCGTGLVQQEINLAGDRAVAGYYDEAQKIWDFIRFEGKNEKIVAQQYEAEEWFAENKDTIMDILDSLEYYAKIQF